MNNEVLSHVVIGGGLSGLVICHGLQQAAHTNWKMFEASSVLGGRLRNDNELNQIDMGAAWLWPDHQPHMRRIVQELALQNFPQPDDPSSTRIEGGTVQIIHKLSEHFDKERVHLNSPVKSCSLETRDGEKLIRLETAAKETYWSRKVIIAAPPRIVNDHISFSPPLSESKQSAMQSSHTWMAGVTKVSLVYPTRFWKNYSNFGLGGFPAFQVYDASTNDGSTLALTFFTVATNVPNDSLLAKQVAGQMSHRWTRFGCHDMAKQAYSYSSFHVQRWPKEPFVSEDAEPRSIHPHPMPNPALAKPEWDGALLFAGSESDLASPGVMEGAVGAAKRVLANLGIL